VSGSVDVLAALKEEPEPQDKSSLKIKRLKGRIKFDNVSFAYADEKNVNVLKDITFDIQPGEHLALVSQSGGGKTTITNLLMRLYLPDSGQIMIDDHDLREVSKQSLRHNIAMVFQDPSLFSGTIRENIAYSKPGATDEEIARAAKAANASEFIDKLDKGYDTEIGERGFEVVWRSKAADCHCQSDSQRCANPYTGRGDECT